MSSRSTVEIEEIDRATQAADLQARNALRAVALFGPNQVSPKTLELLGYRPDGTFPPLIQEAIETISLPRLYSALVSPFTGPGKLLEVAKSREMPGPGQT